MAVYTQQTRVEYEGPGPTRYTVPFPFDAPGDLVLTKIVGETETTLIRGTHYHVAGGRPAAGAVTLMTSLAAGEKLVIQRILPITQLVNLVTQGPYDPRVIEQGFDRLTMIAQQLAGCEGCGGGEGGCSCPAADPGEPDTVVPDPDNPGGSIIIPGDPGSGIPGLITVLQLRMLYAHLQWGSLRHNIGEIQGLQAALDGKLVPADLQPLLDEMAQLQAEVQDKAPAAHTHAFGDIEGKPTTLGAYGITDGVTSGDLADAVNGLAPLASPDFTGTPKLDGYPLLSTRSSLDWARVGNRPDSRAGYGIKDVYTKAEVDQKVASIVPPESTEQTWTLFGRQDVHAWSEVEPGLYLTTYRNSVASVDLGGATHIRLSSIFHRVEWSEPGRYAAWRLLLRIPGEADHIVGALRVGDSPDLKLSDLGPVGDDYDFMQGLGDGQGRLYVGEWIPVPPAYRKKDVLVAFAEAMRGSEAIEIGEAIAVQVEARFSTASYGCDNDLAPEGS